MTENGKMDTHKQPQPPHMGPQGPVGGNASNPREVYQESHVGEGGGPEYRRPVLWTCASRAHTRAREVRLGPPLQGCFRATTRAVSTGETSIKGCTKWVLSGTSRISRAPIRGCRMCIGGFCQGRRRCLHRALSGVPCRSRVARGCCPRHTFNKLGTHARSSADRVPVADGLRGVTPGDSPRAPWGSPPG